MAKNDTADERISTEEIKQDVQNTKDEIHQYQEEISVLSNNRIKNKVDIYIRQGRIFERENFISKLEELLKHRKKLSYT